jgi:hypothetical protein
MMTQLLTPLLLISFLTPHFAFAAYEFEAKINQNYLENVSEAQRERLEKIVKTKSSQSDSQKAKDHFDIGLLALESNKLDIAKKQLFMAHSLDNQEGLYVAWLTKSLLENEDLSPADALALEKKFSEVVSTTNANYKVEEEAFLNLSKATREEVAKLQFEFDSIKSEILTLSKTTPDHPSIPEFLKNLDVINQKIKNLDQSQLKAASLLRRPTDFELETLSQLQVAIEKDNFDVEEKLKAHLKAKATLKVASEMKVRATAVNYNRLANLRFELGSLYNQVYRNVRSKTATHGDYNVQAELKKEYDQLKKEIPLKKEAAEKDFQEKQVSPKVKEKEAKIAAQKVQIEEMNTSLDAALLELNELASKIGEVRGKIPNTTDPSELVEFRKKEAAMIERYIQMKDLFHVEESTVKAMVYVTNKKINDLNSFLNEAYEKSFEDYNKSVKKMNEGLIPNLNQTTERIEKMERPWREALFNRDQEWAIARSELLFSSNNNPTDLLSAAQFKDSEKMPYNNLFSDVSSYTKRPWCDSIDYHCGRCFGLAVLSCEFSQMDARSACAKGENYNARLNNHGTGGMIGSCGMLVQIDENEFMGFSDSTSSYAHYGTYKDWLENQKAKEEFKKLASQIFDDNSNPSTENFLDYLTEVLKNNNSEEAKELASVIEQLKNSTEVFNSDEFNSLIEKLRNAQTDEEKNAVATDLATMAVNVGAHHVPMTSVDDFTLEDAEKLSNMIKYGSIFLDDYKNPTNPLDNAGPMTNLLSATHGVLALSEGAQSGNAEMMMDGIRDTISVLPGASTNPITAIVDIPGEVAASMINVTRDGWNQSSSALEEVGNAINGDPEALNRLENISRDIENTLSPRNYGESMMNALKNRVIDKVPFARTIVNWWNS